MATVIPINRPRGQTRGGVAAVLKYVMQAHKTEYEGRHLVTAINCQPDTCCTEFISTKLQYGKCDGKMYFHFVQSFHPKENITPEKAHAVALELAQQWKDYELIVSTHTDAVHMFAGLVFCADCGKAMTLYRAESMNREQFHLKCYTYGKKGKNYCTPHQIRQNDLEQVVLDDLRRVTHLARMKEQQFAAYINAKNSAELKKEINVLQRGVDTMQRRSDELSALFKRLYEDNVLSRITNEQFRRLSSDYNAEQKALEDAIPGKLERLEKLRASAANVDAFIEKAKRFKTVDKPTPELLRLFIERIEIGERAKKYSHSAAQDIRIVYRDIGMLDSQMEEGEQPVHMVTPPQNIDELMKLLA